MSLSQKFLDMIKPMFDRAMQHASTDSDWNLQDWEEAQTRYEKLFGYRWSR